MGFFAMIASMLLGLFFIVIGLSRRKHKGWSIILITLGIVFVPSMNASNRHETRGGYREITSAHNIWL